MANRIWLAVFLLLTLQDCRPQSAMDQARQLAQSYAACTAKYNRLETALYAKMKTTVPGPDMDTFSAASQRLLTDKKAEMEKMLLESKNKTDSNYLDLLRSKIMIEINRFAEAEKIVERLIRTDEKLAAEAKLQKVYLLLIKRQNTAALDLFKEIELKIKRDVQFFNICLALALTSPETKVREEYSLKILDHPELPAVLQPCISRVYANLAALAKDSRRLEKAKDYLKKALALNSDPLRAASWEAELTQLAALNQPAPPLQADTWFHTPPLSLAALKGQVVVIDFWAPWCLPSRQMMSFLQDEFHQNKDQGLQVIGYTRLYGRFDDGVEKKAKVSAGEELALLKKYLERSKITYPVAVATEGFSFDTYAVTAIPTMVFIDRRGNVAQIQSGTGAVLSIREQIKSLLREK